VPFPEVGNSGSLPCRTYAVVVALSCHVKELREEVIMHTIREDEQQINIIFPESLQS